MESGGRYNMRYNQGLQDFHLSHHMQRKQRKGGVLQKKHAFLIEKNTVESERPCVSVDNGKYLFLGK